MAKFSNEIHTFHHSHPMIHNLTVFSSTCIAHTYTSIEFVCLHTTMTFSRWFVFCFLNKCLSYEFIATETLPPVCVIKLK